MIATLTTLMIGFSVLSAAVLLFAYLFFLKEMQKSGYSKVSAAALLSILTALQLAHLRHLHTGVNLFDSTPYLLLLLAAPPAFYFFGKEVLLPDNRKSVWSVAHFLPVTIGVILPADIAAPLAFVIGTGYAFWFARFVYGMRGERRRFRFEMFFFGLFAILAVLMMILGLSTSYLDPAVLYLSYANFIGLAMVLVVAALIVFPELLGDVVDAARMTYAATTLGGVDVPAKLRELDRLMAEDKVFQNENLNLGLLAEALDISAHQLSELINTQFGIGFSRYIRERRVAEAKRLLAEDASSSVLSIGIAAGFNSQSNFYAAFREMTGEAPGTYRKRTQAGEPDS